MKREMKRIDNCDFAKIFLSFKKQKNRSSIKLLLLYIKIINYLIKLTVGYSDTPSSDL